jgi:hypothetical protein
MIMDDKKISPVVRTIDNVSRQLSLGLIAESTYKGTPVVFCGINFLSQLDRSEVIALYQSLLDYLGGDECKPEKAFDDEFIEILFNRSPEDLVQGNADTDVFG